jgi:hypothetical protein
MAAAEGAKKYITGRKRQKTEDVSLHVPVQTFLNGAVYMALDTHYRCTSRRQ